MELVHGIDLKERIHQFCKQIADKNVKHYFWECAKDFDDYIFNQEHAMIIQIFHDWICILESTLITTAAIILKNNFPFNDV